MAFKMKGFVAHNMYDKKKAETHKEHLELKNKGYTHSPVKKKYCSPMKNDVRKTIGPGKNFNKADNFNSNGLWVGPCTPTPRLI